MKRSGILVLFCILLFGSCLKENNYPAEGSANEYISLLDIRKIYKGSASELTAGLLNGSDKITGVVISDAKAGNIPAGIFVIQQTRRNLLRGIEIVAGDAAAGYKIGDSVIINVNGAGIKRTKGALQIHITNPSAIQKAAEHIPVVPTMVTLKTLKEKFNDYEGTLVKVLNVDADANGRALEGNVEIKEASGATGTIHTESGASFAAKKVAINASYVAIARWYNEKADDTEGAQQQLWLVNDSSVSDESGSLYERFPEDFESGTADIFATGYNTKTGDLRTGSYTLTNAYLGKDGNDRAVSGVYALRLNGNGTTPSWCTMNYDLPNGATKLTLWAGSYGASADLGSIWRIEYSQNGGITWSQLGEDILTVSKDKKQFTFLMDIRGAVRFRIGKLGNGTSTSNNQNGRFSMDDLAIYKNPEAGGPVTNPIPTYQTVMGWQFGTPATAGNEVTLNASSADAGLTTGVLSRGAGLNASGLVRSFASSAGGTAITAAKAIAISQDVYYQVKFSVTPGYKFSLSAIDVRLRRSGAGAKSHRWYYSLDGVNFKETTGTGDVNYEASDTEGLTMPTYYTFLTPELQHIPAGTTVTLRMYCWGFTNIGSGTFSIGRTPAGTTTNALAIGGIVEPQ